MPSLANAAAFALPPPGLAGGFGFTPSEPPAPPPVPSARAPPRAEARAAPAGPSRDEARRIRRLISNRESARRSRLRKQRRLEDLRRRADRLRSENRELAGRLGAVTRQRRRLCLDNHRLRREAAELRRKLVDAQRMLVSRLAPPHPCRGGGGGAVATRAS